MVCNNCEATFDSKFCPECGQKSAIHRITIGGVVHDLVHALTHADKGFLLLAKELITRPGLVAKAYLEGKRKKYFNPITFLLITSAAFGYVALNTGYMDALTGGQRGQSNSSWAQWAEWREVNEIVRNNSGKILSLFLIAPLFAFLTWIFFAPRRFNFAENFVLNSFIFGEAALFRLVIIIPLYFLLPWYPGLITYLLYEIVFLTYIVTAFRQFFQQNIFLIIVKSLVVRILFVVLYWALLLGFVYAKNLFLH